MFFLSCLFPSYSKARVDFITDCEQGVKQTLWSHCVPLWHGWTRRSHFPCIHYLSRRHPLILVLSPWNCGAWTDGVAHGCWQTSQGSVGGVYCNHAPGKTPIPLIQTGIHFGILRRRKDNTASVEFCQWMNNKYFMENVQGNLCQTMERETRMAVFASWNVLKMPSFN